MKRSLYIGILVTITIICVLAGTLINVGKNMPVFSFFSKDSKSISKDYSELSAGFSAIDLNTDIGDITIESSKAFGAEFTGLEKLAPIMEIKDGVLVVTQEDKNNVAANPATIKARIKITVPEGTQLTSVKAHLDLGDLKLEDISADKLTISESLGDIKINGCVFKSAEITENLGDIKMDLPGSEEDYGMDLDVSLGDIKVNGENKGNKYTKEGSIPIKASNDLGDIKIKTK